MAGRFAGRLDLFSKELLKCMGGLVSGAGLGLAVKLALRRSFYNINEILLINKIW
jgi:hypothetical protein